MFEAILVAVLLLIGVRVHAHVTAVNRIALQLERAYQQKRASQFARWG